jgi:hypothetical protein
LVISAPEYFESKYKEMEVKDQSWSRKFGQRDRWSFCLMAGTLCPSNQERP